MNTVTPEDFIRDFVHPAEIIVHIGPPTGLHHALIDAIPITVVKRHLVTELCPICRETFEHHRFAKSLSCAHLCHPACLNHWLKRSNTCPICRQKA